MIHVVDHLSMESSAVWGCAGGKCMVLGCLCSPPPHPLTYTCAHTLPSRTWDSHCCTSPSVAVACTTSRDLHSTQGHNHNHAMPRELLEAQLDSVHALPAAPLTLTGGAQGRGAGAPPRAACSSQGHPAAWRTRPGPWTGWRSALLPGVADGPAKREGRGETNARIRSSIELDLLLEGASDASLHWASSTVRCLILLMGSG